MKADEVHLRERVALMRELGVMRWDGIELGPAPVAPAKPARPETPEEKRAAALAQWRQSVRDKLPDGEFLTDVQVDMLQPPPANIGGAS